MNINHDCIGNDYCKICTGWQLSDCSQVQLSSNAINILSIYQSVVALRACKDKQFKIGSYFFVVTREFSICIVTLLQLFKIGLLHRVWQSP